MKCGPELAGLLPQMTTSRLLSTSAGSGPWRAPRVAPTATWEAAQQIVRSSPLAPMRPQSRSSQTPIWTRPRVPL